MKILLTVLFAITLMLSGCSGPSSQHTLGKTSAERVAAMADLLKKRISIPGPILDAECIEEQKVMVD